MAWQNMSWMELHRESETLAGQAHEALRAGSRDKARSLFAAAAKFETEALEETDPRKSRTYGITAVSAVALWFKAGRLTEAEAVARRAMAARTLPEFAASELSDFLASIAEEVQQEAKRAGGTASSTSAWLRG
jgi:hypothetical protein